MQKPIMAMAKPFDIDSLNINNMNFGKVINDYPGKVIPLKLHDRTGKAKKCQFEAIDLNLYQREPKMVTFHTSRPRIQPWIATLDIFYYQYLGNDESLTIKWYDVPESWTEITNNNSIVIETINKEDNRLMFNITFFVTTGTIRVQGTNYMTFVEEHFKILKDILKKVLTVWNETENENMIKAEQMSIDNLPSKTVINPHEVSCEDDTSDSESEIGGTTSGSSQTSLKLVEMGDETLINTPMIESHEFASLEDSFMQAFQKMENCQSSSMKTISENTDLILSLCKEIKAKMENMKSSPSRDSISTVNSDQSVFLLKSKISSLEDQLKLEKSNSAIAKGAYETNIKTLQALLDNSRRQAQEGSDSMRVEMEQFREKLRNKEAENERLTENNGILKGKLDKTQDELINLKSQMSELMDKTNDTVGASENSFRAVQNSRSQPAKPRVLLIGTSNCKEINEARISNSVVVNKVIKYVIKDAISYVVSNESVYEVVCLHVLTNDLKNLSPENCVKYLEDLVSAVRNKWPNSKVIISLATPRKDNINYHTNGQIINALVKQRLIANPNDHVYYCEHNNMLYQGNPIDDLLEEDKYHLSQKGVSYLANNIKRAIHETLNIPIPSRPRGRSPGRGQSLNRGRGRGRGNDRD